MRNPSPGISPPPGRTGRPRSAAADAAILAATRDALVELGWSKLTMGDVSARAGVAKTTLYRRWAGKNELVVDAVAELFDALELPDRGSSKRTSSTWSSSSRNCCAARRPVRP